MTIQVGYWNIRGLIGGVRLMLEYAGADWNETFYEGNFQICFQFETSLIKNIYFLIAHKTESGWDRTEWTNVKATAEFQEGFAFPNLPYLVDGDVKIWARQPDLRKTLSQAPEY